MYNRFNGLAACGVESGVTEYDDGQSNADDRNVLVFLPRWPYLSGFSRRLNKMCGVVAPPCCWAPCEAASLLLPRR